MKLLHFDVVFYLTENPFPQVMVVPVPVPVYVPLPMNMYTQCTPRPVGLPIPVGQIRSTLIHTRGIDILRGPSVHHHEVDNRANLLIFETPTEHIGPHLSNKHTANSCAHDHFYARIGISIFVHEHTIPSNLMSGLTSWLQFRVDLRCNTAKSEEILTTMIKRTSVYW